MIYEAPAGVRPQPRMAAAFGIEAVGVEPRSPPTAAPIGPWERTSKVRGQTCSRNDIAAAVISCSGPMGGVPGPPAVGVRVTSRKCLREVFGSPAGR